MLCVCVCVCVCVCGFVRLAYVRVELARQDAAMQCKKFTPVLRCGCPAMHTFDLCCCIERKVLTPDCGVVAEFAALRSELIATSGSEVASIVQRLSFPPKTWGVVSLSEAEIEERRVGLESEQIPCPALVEAITTVAQFAIL